MEMQRGRQMRIGMELQNGKENVNVNRGCENAVISKRFFTLRYVYLTLHLSRRLSLFALAKFAFPKHFAI